LERGLKVLQALQENSISSLHDIHRLTRISKPSLLRILHTLEQSGVISRRLADRRYRISTNLSHLARNRDSVGRAYLAFCPENERQKILALLRKSDKPENRLARETRRVDRILAETRANGFGTRDPSFIGGAYGRQTPDGLNGMAVPLLDRGRVHGVINIVWAKAAREVDDMVRDHLGDLKAAASEIVELLRYQARRM
jgi:DNA-binding IclR family transcriptional regulator